MPYGCINSNFLDLVRVRGRSLGGEPPVCIDICGVLPVTLSVGRSAMLKRWWVVVLALAGLLSEGLEDGTAHVQVLETSAAASVNNSAKAQSARNASVSAEEKSPPTASTIVPKVAPEDNGTPPTKSVPSSAQVLERSVHEKRSGASGDASIGNKKGTGGGGDKKITVELRLWDILMLLLLILLALSSSAALLAGSFVGDLQRRFCHSWGPLRRFMRMRNRSRIKLQILVSQYERVAQERARIAAALRKQAQETEETLEIVRRRYAKELTESGFLRQLRRFLSSGAWAEDGVLSCSSSDCSTLSTNTVESLVHQRIQAEGRGSRSSRSASDLDSGESEEESLRATRSGGSAAFRQQDVAQRTRCSAKSNTPQCCMRRPRHCEKDDGTDSDDELPSLPTESMGEDKKLAYKFSQLRQRKSGALRDIIQSNATASKPGGLVSSNGPADRDRSSGKTDDGML